MKHEDRWPSYYQAVSGRPPRETLLTALDLFAADRSACALRETAPFAIDLGCGNGRDTIELLRRGWQVLAIDGQAEAIARLNQEIAHLTPLESSLENYLKTQLETQIQPFEQLVLSRRADLINASFCLPFCTAKDFPRLWYLILSTLKPGGRFCGHLFGDRDDWSERPYLLTHTRTDVDQLLSSLTVEWFYEEEHSGQTPLGEDRHWHIFNIVARKV